MIIDILLGLLLVGAIYRGREIGMVRQMLSLAGFTLGIFAGAWLQPHLVNSANTTASRAMLSFLIILASALLVLTIGEYAGVWLKRKLQHAMTADKADAILGSMVGVASFLVGIWLVYPLVVSLPAPGLQQLLKQSAIISRLNATLPPAPQVLSSIDHLINPNGFPDVFAGLERTPVQTDAPLPDLGDLQAAVQKTRPSVVKVEGRGCGGIVEGSGYIAAKDVVITNAHVVAGVNRPTVIDQAGRHTASAIWFDPNLDMAVLRVEGLAGAPLQTATSIAGRGTASVVVGYPGGGGFTAKPASVLDQFTATGRNIYGEGATNRSIYELKADIIPGNSGGPLLDKNGTVIGLIFAQSTTYDQVGYALTMQPVVDGLNQALARNQTVSTAQCAAD